MIEMHGQQNIKVARIISLPFVKKILSDLYAKNQNFTQIMGGGGGAIKYSTGF